MSNDNRLGKGLSALLGERLNNYKDNNSSVGQFSVKQISIEFVYPNRYQPRKVFDIEEIKQLSNSIKEHGLLQPITVRKHPEEEGRYEIIAGERRYRAFKMAGIETIPVIIKNDFDDKKSLVLAIIENIHRANLTPIEEAEAYRQLVEEFAFSHNKISETVGKSRSHIANLIRLLNLPQEIKDKLTNKIIEMGHARALINSEHALEIAQIIEEKGLNVRETEQLVKEYKEKMLHEKGEKLKRRRTKPDFLYRFEKIVHDSLGLKSRASFDYKKGKGKIVINYKNTDDLERIINKLAN